MPARSASEKTNSASVSWTMTGTSAAVPGAGVRQAGPGALALGSASQSSTNSMNLAPGTGFAR